MEKLNVILLPGTQILLSKSWYLNLCTLRMRLTKFLPLSRNSGYGNNWFRMGPVAPWTCSAPLKAEGGFISMRRAPKEKPFCMYCFSKAAVICPTSRILHCSMLIFQRDNFSTISTPARNRKPFMGRTPGSCTVCQVKQWLNASTGFLHRQ